MQIPRSLRDLQVERESLFWDFSSQRLFHLLDLLFGQRRQQFSFRAVISDAMSCDHEGQGSVHVLVDDHLASSQGGTPLGTLDLHDQVAKTYGVISINGALVSLREDHFKVPVAAGYEWRVPRCAAGNREAAVIELGDVMLGKKLVGSFQRS